MAELRMRFLGDIDLTIDRAPLAGLKSKKALALLCYLAVTGVAHDRLALATLLWADTPEANARMNLRKVVAALRKSMGSYLVITNETLALDRQSEHWIDVRVLEEAGSKIGSHAVVDVANLGRLQEATDLYRGDFLAGFYLRNAPLFEEWALAQQARLRELALDSLHRLAAAYAEREQLPEAISATRRLLQLEPWREEAHRQLMLFLARSGRRSEALAQFESCRQILAQEFGAEPAPATVALFEAIRDDEFESPLAHPPAQELTVQEDRGRPPPSPYRGLFAFRQEDAPFFFGREAFSERLVAAAHRQTLVAIVGPSGSGKSSLAAAGLVAGLAGDETWRFALLRPGSQPFQALAATLVPLLEPGLSETGRLVEAGKMATAIRQGQLSVSSVVDRILQINEPAGRLLILVDQFEELYTLCLDPDLRHQFLDQLLTTAQEQGRHSKPAACISLTLRADFMEQALAHRPFADALQETTLILGPMSREELSAAIEKPAGRQGVTFEAGLAERILDDVGPKPGNLPLLEFALARLWEEQDGWLLTHQAYEATGRVEGALALHADEVYTVLSERDRSAARRVIAQMVSPGYRGDDTRRLALRREIGVGDWLLVRHLADARLLVTGRDSAGRETAELVHEALITAWGRLQNWLEEDRAFRLWQERLRTTLATWQAAEGDEGVLLRGGPLAEAEGWLAEQDRLLGQDELAFIRESQALRDRKQIEQEEIRSTRERTRRRIIIGLTILLIAAFGAMVFAFAQSRRAEAQARLAFARELTSAAVANLQEDPELSIHLALQAIRTTLDKDGNVIVEAEDALHRALQASRVLYALPKGGGLAFSPDGDRLATGGEDGLVTLSAALSGETLQTFSGLSERTTGVSFSQAGDLLAAVSEDRQTLVWDLETGQPLLELPTAGGSGPILGSSTVAFSPDGDYLLVAGPTADTEIWQVATGQKRLHIEDSASPDAAFSPDGRYLALTTAVWDLSTALRQDQNSSGAKQSQPLNLAWSDRLFDFARVLVGIQAPSSSNNSAFQESGSVAFDPDGSRLLASVISNQAILVDAATGDLLQTLSGHGGIIHALAFSPDGTRLATASADGTSRVWDAETGESLVTFAGHQDEVVELAFSPDGKHLATSSLDGSTRVWDISAGQPGEWLSRFEHDGPVSAAFNPQGDRLVTVGVDGAVILLDPRTGETIYRGDLERGSFADPSFSPDGARLALGFEGGRIIIQDAVTGEATHSFEGGTTTSSLAFSPDGRLLATGDAAGLLTIWEMSNDTALARWQVHDSFITGLAFSTDGDRLASAGVDGLGLIMETDRLLAQKGGGGAAESGGKLPDEAILASLVGHNNLIVSLGSDSESAHLVTASWDGTARVWDGQNGDLLLILAGHRGQVIEAIFSPDGRRIATAGSDGQVIIWDAQSGEQLFQLASLETPLRSLAFSPDGRFLAVGGDDGSLRVYISPVEELMGLAEARLTRDLTGEECRRYLHLERCPD